MKQRIAALFMILMGLTAVQSVAAQQFPITFDTPGYQLVKAFPSPDGVHAVVFPNATFNDYMPLEDYLRFLNLRTGETVAIPQEPADYVETAAFNSDGSVLATIHSNGDIYLWNMATYEIQQRWELGYISGAYFATFMPDDRTLMFVVRSLPDTIYFMDIETGAFPQILRHRFNTQMEARDLITVTGGTARYSYSVIALSPDASTLGLASAADEVFLWDIATRERTVLRTESERIPQFLIEGISFSADGELLVYTEPRAETITLVSLADNTASTVLPLVMNVFALSPDGSSIAWINREENVLYLAGLDATDEPVALLQLSERARVIPRITAIHFLDERTLLLSGLSEQEGIIYRIDVP